VELTNFAFTPARLAARVGDTIQLELCNLDIAAPHLFEISALRISEVVAAGSARAVEFVVEKEGTYTSLCPLDTAGVNHAEAGMIGELIVEAAP
jgi:plastocyanin